jgi:hypothetical protein
MPYNNMAPNILTAILQGLAAKKQYKQEQEDKAYARKRQEEIDAETKRKNDAYIAAQAAPVNDRPYSATDVAIIARQNPGLANSLLMSGQVQGVEGNTITPGSGSPFLPGVIATPPKLEPNKGVLFNTENSPVAKMPLQDDRFNDFVTIRTKIDSLKDDPQGQQFAASMGNAFMANKYGPDWAKSMPTASINQTQTVDPLAPKPNAIKKVEPVKETSNHSYYVKMRKDAMAGRFSKQEWYKDPLLKVYEFPGLSPTAQRAVDKANKPPVSKRGGGFSVAKTQPAKSTTKQLPTQMGRIQQQQAAKYGFSSSAIKYAPNEVSNNIGYQRSQAVGDTESEREADFMRRVRKAAKAVNAKYKNHSQSASSANPTRAEIIKAAKARGFTAAQINEALKEAGY